jgi:hypothetical protein
MKKFNQSIYQEIWRVRRNGANEPLRTVTELSEILGITPQKLGKLLAKSDAPRCVINHKANNAVSRSKWYRPTEVMKWWREQEKSAA